VKIFADVWDSSLHLLGVKAQGNVASGATDSGNPVKTGGKYNSTPITLTDGQRGDLQLDVNGNTKATLATGLNEIDDAVTVYPAGCNMTVVDTSVDSTVVSPAPALLLGVYVNTALSAHTVVIKDDTIAKLTLPASLAAGYKIDCHSAQFVTSLVIDPDDSSTGEIVIFWMPS
jgi:hypothetical protein